jgi:acyl CoA:acetate/3-ketoacid CoA transferase
VRQVVARRAADELCDGAVINYGYGIPDGVAKLVATRRHGDRYYQSIEHGAYGGTLLEGSLFGYARNPSAIIDAPSQFDFYSGGGLDIAFLGFAQIDAAGNVNVSKLAGLPVGPGGFIDIAQNARKVVFCGAFDTKGAQYATGDGRMRITRHGDVRKMVQRVDQITFSGSQALRQRQQIVYVTERAVFRLTAEGVMLTEIAPGLDLQRDVLERMEFRPVMPAAPATIATDHFEAKDRRAG